MKGFRGGTESERGAVGSISSRDALVPSPEGANRAGDGAFPSADGFIPGPDLLIPSADGSIPGPDLPIPGPDGSIPGPNLPIPIPVESFRAGDDGIWGGNGGVLEFNFGLPLALGEVSQADLTQGLSTTSANTNTVSTLNLAADDPPTQATMQQIINKLDELINVLRR